MSLIVYPWLYRYHSTGSSCIHPFQEHSMAIIGIDHGISTQRRLVEALCDPSRFTHAAKTVHLIETHISWVLLAGRYAYKIKKAVNLGFLDFTDLSARHFYCEEEIRINRRLAPRLYLDVVAIGGSPQQ